MKVKHVLRMLMATMFCWGAGQIRAGETSFVVEGNMNQVGVPAEGLFDFESKLFGAGAERAQIGQTIIQKNVPVSKDRFKLTLDFGEDIRGRSDRLVQIGVKPAGSQDAFTIIIPAQVLEQTTPGIFRNHKIGKETVEKKFLDYGGVLLKGIGPEIIFTETDQQMFRRDYGYWRIVCDHNNMFFEVWENPKAKEGDMPFDIQDEFLAFHRCRTDSYNESGNHLIQWSYDFLGHGVRDLKIGANWADPGRPQTPRMLSLVALNGQTNDYACAMNIIPNGPQPIVVFPVGHVGIGTTEGTPGNILTVARNSQTDPIADGWTVYSSQRWQKDVKPIKNALDKVKHLEGVCFEWVQSGQNDIGMVAEQTGRVVPEMVTYEANRTDAKGIDYARLVPILVEAIKEQQKQIEELQQKLDMMSK
jgi:hypothetical protein